MYCSIRPKGAVVRKWKQFVRRIPESKANFRTAWLIPGTEKLISGATSTASRQAKVITSSAARAQIEGERAKKQSARLPGRSWVFYATLGLVLAFLSTVSDWVIGLYPIGTFTARAGMLRFMLSLKPKTRK
jgi:hypothetical protein